ncbi:uncharacterized protein [Hetaerina americana]|uniref:uncharacterized protein n=1 Tax=Hetaerina americana TaxID=62018 RepID=UPI003A7F1443
MATVLRSYIFITFIVCCISFAILVTSVSTTSWVNARLLSNAGNEEDIVNYGLFIGTLKKIAFATPSYYTIHMACIPKDNVCAWSCKKSAEEREEEIQNLYTTANASFGCIEKDSKGIRNVARSPWDIPKPSITNLMSPTVRGSVDKTFINLGIWASTLTSLILAIVLAGVAALGAVVNIAANPVRTIAAIPGLYIWNGLAAFFAILTMVLWGGHFAASLVDSIALRETITGECHVDTARVGFSYWLILASALLHLANIGILLFRRVMLLRIPEPPKVTPAEDTDGTLFLY